MDLEGGIRRCVVAEIKNWFFKANNSKALQCFNGGVHFAVVHEIGTQMILSHSVFGTLQKLSKPSESFRNTT